MKVMPLGERVLELRKLRGLTQVQLAKAAGLPQETVSRVETGMIAQPRLGVVAGLAKALGVTVDHLATGRRMTGEEIALADPQAVKALRQYQRLDRRGRATVLAMMDAILKTKTVEGGT